MHTKDMLAEELKKIGLDKMAEKAATGYYHDFLSPLAMPELTLIDDLLFASNNDTNPETAEAILALRVRVMNGDFDATKEEGDEWAASPEGQEVFGKLIR